jgi:hypothetical protein
MRIILATVLLFALPRPTWAACPSADTAGRLEAFKVETNDYLLAIFELIEADSRAEVRLEKRLRELERSSGDSLHSVVIEELMRRAIEQRERIEALERQVEDLRAGAQIVPSGAGE